MAMAALRLRRRHLLADPTRFLLTRIEPQIHLIRSAAAAASLPSQRAPDPFRLGSYIHPHRLPSPRSTRSAASIDSHRTPSPRPIHSVPSVSLHHFSPPRSTLSAFSIGDHCPSAEDQCHMGLLAAVGAGPRALPRGRRASSHLMGNQAARRILSAADPRLPQVSPSRSLGLGPKRFFSSGPATSPEFQRRRLPPVSQLVFRDDSQVLEEEWVDPIEYLKEHSLLVDARTNYLNLEIPGFGDHPRYNFSEDTGVPLFQSLVFLALINNNRGYCVKNSFTMDNVLLCPRLKQFRFKVVDQDDVHLNSVNRASSYFGAAQLMRQLLHDTVGADAIACLLEEPRDLFSKLERPSDERLIMYHPSFLSTNGRIWFYQKLYMFFFKVIPFSDDVNLTNLAKTALDNMAYTSPSAQSIEDIIKEHPLLAHIDSKGTFGCSGMFALLCWLAQREACPARRANFALFQKQGKACQRGLQSTLASHPNKQVSCLSLLDKAKQ